METVILVMICLASTAFSDEVYQNSKNICEKCKCTDAAEFVMDCTNQSFEHVLANWPPHNKSLVATFSYNNMTTLETLPITDQKAKLVLDHCNIRYLDEGAFSRVKNVEFIDLSYNLLTTEEIDGQDFKGPYINNTFHPLTLKHLNLAYNQIHSLPRKFFESTPDLEELNLEGNDFTVLDPNTQMALQSVTNLRVLNLANNELTELAIGAIRNLHHLEDLDLSSNTLDFVPDFLRKEAPTLKILKLNGNNIFRLDERSFSGLDLEEIHLDHLPKLDYIRPGTFSDLKHLRKLSISNNRILRRIDKLAFDEKQRLNELYLNNNSLTELKFELLDWRSLKVFEMNDNQLECNCDLYNISKALESIKRNVDGPDCINLYDDRSTPIYSLTAHICGYEGQPYHMYHAVRHFQIIRSVIITLSLMISLGAVIALTVGILRYRRGVAFRNYPFTAQVTYYPVANSISRIS